MPATSPATARPVLPYQTDFRGGLEKRERRLEAEREARKLNGNGTREGQGKLDSSATKSASAEAAKRQHVPELDEPELLRWKIRVSKKQLDEEMATCKESLIESNRSDTFMKQLMGIFQALAMRLASRWCSHFHQKHWRLRQRM